ncbi:MAG: glycosyltransferase family 4 protein [Herpetosiphon sp.]
MRVLMLSWEYPPHMVGGMGKHVYDLVPALGNAGIDVHVVTPNMCPAPAHERISAGVMIHRAPVVSSEPQGGSLIDFVRSCNSSLERTAEEVLQTYGSFDVIHCHDWLVGYSAVALKHSQHLPLIVTVHATERGRGQGYVLSDQSHAIDQVEWWLTYEAWRIITVSRFMGEQIADYFGLPADKISVINNGVNVLDGPPRTVAERQAARQRWVGPDEHLVLYVGRVVYEKGIQVLIAAAPGILERVPNTHFVIAGTGSYLETLKQNVVAAGLEKAFSFPGFIADEQRDELYDVADVAVFPSLYEPFGIVALEAMAHLCPVVVAATGGLQEVVRLHDTGMTSHVGNAESLAWAVAHTLLHPKWARARSINAFHEVQKLYSWRRIADQTRDVYRHIHEDWTTSAWGLEHEGSTQ